MATTYNFTNGSITNQPRMTQRTPVENGIFILRHVLDFSKQTIQAGASDVAQALIIPAGTEVIDAWLRVITAETDDATVDFGYGSDANYFGANLNVDATGVAKRVLEASETWDAGSIADGDEEEEDITVAGAALGDRAVAVLEVDTADLTVTAAVTAEDQVTVTVANNTGAAVDLASTTLTVYVFKQRLAGSPLHFAAADTLDITATILNGDVDIDGLKVEAVAMCRKTLDY
jgi:hypothetical protein